MSEAKRCEILLLDERKLDILVQPKLLVGELIDIASSHFNLREKEYFGIWYKDNMNRKRWLRKEKKVLDHPFSKTATVIELIFGVRLYVQSITHLKEAITIELFFLQANKLMCQDELDCDEKTVFLLAAYAMQVSNGDYISESITRDDLKRGKILPEGVTNDLPEEECVERIVFHYKRMIGLPRGDAIVNFLSIVERLPKYGVHFYDAKDKNEKNMKLGVSHRGIGQFIPEDTLVARKIYLWSRMENLYYRDKKFSIEIRDLTRTGSNQSMNSITKYATLRARQPQPVVDTWYCPTTVDARELWAISVGYHQQLVHNKDLQAVRTLKDIAKELTRSTSSLATSVDSEFTGSVCSGDVFWYDQDYGENMYSDLIAALTSKKEMLEMRLNAREAELKELIRQEEEITSSVRERNSSCSDSSVGATFHFSDEVLNTSNSNEEMEKLSRDYEIQSQITAAAKRLSMDPKAKRRVRKERRKIYESALSKLRELEARMKNLKNSSADVTMVADSSVTQRDENVSLSEQQPFQDEVDYDISTAYETFQYPDNSLTRRAMSFNSNEIQDDYYDTLRKNLRKLRREASDLSPSSRRMVTSRYVIGDFDNSGIYSGLRNGRTNESFNHYRNIEASTSLTQIPRTHKISITHSSSGSLEELGRQSAQQQYIDRRIMEQQNDYNTFKTHEHNPKIIESLENGFEENRGSYRSSRPLKTNRYGSSSGSLLSGAAWSQLSQPSMENMMHSHVSLSSDGAMDCHYLSDELERLSNELIMEGDEEPEETLV